MNTVKQIHKIFKIKHNGWVYVGFYLEMKKLIHTFVKKLHIHLVISMYF